jgi:bifunctional enzyme CysN/CysC/sulfate adenylyltransferase subunit 1
VRKIRYGVDIHSAEQREVSQLHMNDIAEVEFDTSLPLFFDAYTENREMGALILIDPVSNATVGAAMILAAAAPVENAREGAKGAAFIWLRNMPEEAEAFREALRARGRAAVIVDDVLIPEASLGAVVRALQLAEVTAISARGALSDSTIRDVREVAGDHLFESVADASKWLDASSNAEETR